MSRPHPLASAPRLTRRAVAFAAGGILASPLLRALPTAAQPSTPPAASPAPGSTDAAQFRADPAHTGSYPGTGPTAAPEVLWRFPTEGVRAAVTVAGGTVYVGTLDGYLHAIDAATGEERWNAQPGGYVGTPAVSGGIVFTSGQGTFLALDAATGAEVWSGATEASDLFSEATVADGTLVVGSYDGSIHALDPATGGVIWRVPTGSRVWMPPTVVDGNVLVRNDAGDLLALALDDGAEIWRTAIGWDNEFSVPAVATGIVVVGGNGTVGAFDAATGGAVWQAPAPGVTTSAALVGGMAVIASQGEDGAGVLMAMDLATGIPRWEVPLGAGVSSAPTVAGEIIYLGDSDGMVRGHDLASGIEIWRMPTDGGYLASDPVIADGVLYTGSVGADAHNVYALA